MATLFEEMKKKLIAQYPELDTSRKMSEAQKRIQPLIHTPEFNKKTGEAQKGKVMSVESREKMRIAHLGKPLNEAQKRGIGIATKRRWEEDKEGMTASIIEGMDNLEYHEKLSMAQKKLNENTEYKEQRIEATKAGYDMNMTSMRNDLDKVELERSAWAFAEICTLLLLFVFSVSGLLGSRTSAIGFCLAPAKISLLVQSLFKYSRSLLYCFN